MSDFDTLPTNEFDLEIEKISDSEFSIAITVVVGSGGGTSLTAQTLGDTIAAADAKDTPVNTDNLVLSDSDTGDIAKRITWSNFILLLSGLFDAIGAAAAAVSAHLSAAPHKSALSEMTEDTTHRVVTDTEKGTWNGKQDALGFTPENAANKNAANGYCPLDSGSIVPPDNLPANLMTLEGPWDANRNIPELQNGMATYNAGAIFECTTPGTVNFGTGDITFALGDWAVYGADSIWYKSLNSNAVISVNSKTGTVTINPDDLDDTTSTHKFVSAAEKSDFHASGSDAETATSIAAIITGASADTITTNDEIPWYKITGGLLKKITYGNFIALLNAIYSPILTFSSGLTRTVNDIKNNLITGLSGGQTVIGGTGASEDLVLSSTSNVTKGSITIQDKTIITPLAKGSETLIATGLTFGTGQLEATLTTDNQFITDSTLITALLLETNWLLEVYSGTIIGAVEGQFYVGVKYLYLFKDSVFTRYPISTNANIGRVKSSIVASAAINTTDTIISTGAIANGIKIDANTLVAGSSFNVYIFGTCTSSNADVSTFTGRIGTANTIADAALFTKTLSSAGSGTDIPFCIKIRFTVRTIGATASIYGHVEVINEGITGIYTASTQIGTLTSVAAHDSRNNNYLNISYFSAANTTTCTFQNVILEQIK